MFALDMLALPNGYLLTLSAPSLADANDIDRFRLISGENWVWKSKLVIWNPYSGELIQQHRILESRISFLTMSHDKNVIGVGCSYQNMIYFDYQCNSVNSEQK